MQSDLDHYEIYYADRLWMLMPEVYRAGDSDLPDVKGPLRELCDRIGAQMAIVRRSIDRSWEDQSIESCDDWVVPYIGELLATNLVSGLDARGRRLEVANTIFYRRRKGTLLILEKIAQDVSGWDARVVEFFRRLGRTRHGLDPAIGLPSASPDVLGAARLQLASGLVGPRSRTPIGGTANLRNAYAAKQVNTAFDEFFHTPDVRRGSGAVGWYNIPRLGVFLWRLYSFPQTADDPNDLLSVPVAGNGARGNCFTFDPTGRTVPLFATAARTGESFGATWVSPTEPELPGPIAQALVDDVYSSTSDAAIDMRSVGVFHTDTGDLVKRADVSIWPEFGRFSIAANPNLRVWYHYGFSSRLGAAAFDRRPFGDAAPAPGTETVVRNGTAVAAMAATSTTTFGDSLTYADVPDLTSVNDVTIRSGNGRRPVIRTAPDRTPWTFNASGATPKLRLEGIFFSGADIVLSGSFDEVTIRFSTLDPGQAGVGGTRFATSFDDRELHATTLWIEGTVRALTIDHSITGPIRSRRGGSVEQLVIRDSIVQSIPEPPKSDFAIADFKDIEAFVRILKAPPAGDPVATALRNALKNPTRSQLNLVRDGARIADALRKLIVDDINAALPNAALFPPRVSRSVILRSHSANNHDFIADAFPLELGAFALALDSGAVLLEHVTLLGGAYVHRIDVSESILDDVVWVENPQLGCVRFSAWSSGSILPRKYESVEIAPRAELFTSRMFAQPGYAQLRSDVDAAVSAGAQNGSEMGAFYSEMAAIKEQSLLIKFQEFMPVGLVPVIVHVT